jgi:Zn finger protein HypA/HybF involved in hydrogenase expression
VSSLTLMRKPFRKECAYCSRKFETKNPKQDTCPNCKALLKFTSGAMAEAINS